MAFNYDFGTGLLQGIMQAAEQRKAKKHEMLQTLLQDPEIATDLYGENQLNRVMAPEKRANYQQKWQENKDWEVFRQLPIEVQSKLSGVTDLHMKNIQPAIEQVYKEKKAIEDKDRELQYGEMPWTDLLPEGVTPQTASPDQIKQAKKDYINRDRNFKAEERNASILLPYLFKATANPRYQEVLAKNGITDFQNVGAKVGSVLKALQELAPDLAVSAITDMYGNTTQVVKQTEGGKLTGVQFGPTTGPTAAWAAGASLAGGTPALPNGWTWEKKPGSKVQSVAPVGAVRRKDGKIILPDNVYEGLTDPSVMPYIKDSKNFVRQSDNDATYNAAQQSLDMLASKLASGGKIQSADVAAYMNPSGMEFIKQAMPSSKLLITGGKSLEDTPEITMEDVQQARNAIKKFYNPMSRAAAGSESAKVANVILPTNIQYSIIGKPSTATSQPSENRTTKLGTAPHYGTDIAVPVGTPVYFPWQGGTVTFAGSTKEGGKTVRVRLADGTTISYLHLSKINVKEGQTISGNKPIAASGNTGTHVIGKGHLHVSIIRNGVVYDLNMQPVFDKNALRKKPAAKAAPQQTPYTEQAQSTGKKFEYNSPAVSIEQQR